MSAYSDWRCGAISDMEFIQACRNEEWMHTFRGNDRDPEVDDEEDDGEDEEWDER